MLPLIIAALLISQDAPVFGITLSDDPEPPVVEEVKRPVPNLPAHAISDPFGWERSQCSPYLRKDESLAECQVRVRADLQAVMGDALPAALIPTAGFENCHPGTAENNFKVVCGPREMTLPNQPNLQAKECVNEPRRTPDGRVVIQSICSKPGELRPSDGRGMVVYQND